MVTCQTLENPTETQIPGSGQISLIYRYYPWRKKKREEGKGEKDTKEIHVIIQMAKKNSKIFSTSLITKWS